MAVFAAIGALSHQRERAFSASLIYLALGLLAAAAIQGLGVGWLDPIQDASTLEHVTELTVVAALFASGLQIDRALEWRQWSSVARMLLVAMPVTIGLVALFGSTVLGLSLGAAIALGAMLAPTDPVLAGDLGVGPPGQEDDEHEPNFALTAEAGFNDGLAFPFILLGLFVAEGGDWTADWLLADVLYAVGGACLLGGALGYGLAASIVRLRDRRLLNPHLDGWVAVAATLAIYGIAQVADTYGFLAVFVGGLAFRRYEHGHDVNGRVHQGAEIVEKFAELAVILLLGSMLTLDGLGAPGVAGWALAVVLIVVIRPVSTVLALFGSRVEHKREKAFVSWFGVRGVGTLYYAAVVAVAGTFTPEETQLLVWTAIACVLLSIPVHGITGGPVLRRFNRRQDDEAQAAAGSSSSRTSTRSDSKSSPIKSRTPSSTAR